MKSNYFSIISAFFVFFLSVITAYAQKPVANFSADNTSGCGIVTVRFTDGSLNNPTSWLWDFGEGGTSDKKNPVIAFVTPGEYNVRLTVTNSAGSDSQLKTAFIKVYELPQVGLLATHREGCVPLSVEFTDITESSDSPITSRVWDFGDGDNSSLKTPTHVYSSAGNYTVSLTVTNQNGCSHTVARNSYIQVENRPTANFTALTRESCTAPFTVDFTSTSVGAISTYAWSFGDGATSTAPNPTHTYTADGTYSVNLTVSSASSCSHSCDSSDFIFVNTFKADFVADTTAICSGESVIFSDNSNFPVVSHLWDFGDGTTSTLANPTKTYATSGLYTISYTAVTAAGCSSTKTNTNYITVHALPEVHITANDSVACVAPFSVNFSLPDPNITSWAWNFGDAASSNEQNPTHVYTNTGTYSVSVAVTDIHSCSATATKTNYIRIKEPTAQFNSNVLGGCFPLNVQFIDMSSSDNPITSWNWDFGDGGTSTDKNPNYTFAVDTGRFDITLTITDDLACTKTIVMAEHIGVGNPPDVGFFVDNTLVCYNAIANFTDTSKVDLQSEYVNFWRWDFGDGGTSTMKNPEYVYADTGVYTVILEAAQNLCFASDTIEDYITILPPIARYTLNPQFLCETPDTILFVEDAVLADTYTWNFGDGNSLFIEKGSGDGLYNWTKNNVLLVTDTTAINPLHEYAVPGVYETQLKVTNTTFACADSMSITLNVAKMNLGFTQDTLFTCQYLGVSFTDTTKINNDFSITNWQWDFGDGSPRISGVFPTPTHMYESSGLFDVTLIVTNSIGCTDSLIQSNFITIYEVPSPQFTADVLTGCTPLDVSFTQSSVAVAPETVVEWFWNFGDGNTVLIEEGSAPGLYNWTKNGISLSTDTVALNPTHTYINRGSYTVSLTVVDSKGCDSTLSRTNYIVPTYPFPSFTIDPVVCHYNPAEFINTSTGTDLSYEWNFADASPLSADINPTHKYSVTKDTIVTVRLKAVDINGCDSTFATDITIARPYALFTADTTKADCPPFIPQFTDTSGLVLATWLWNFGDALSGSNNTSGLQNAQHSYAASGTYDVQLVVTDVHGCLDTILKTDYIDVGGPTGTFTFNPTVACAPAEVEFAAVAHNAIEYRWVFGDGGELFADDTVVYTYVHGRSYFPVLLLRDINDCIYQVPAPELLHVYEAHVDFEALPPIACSEQNITFVNTTKMSHDVDAWTWQFSDSSISNAKDTAYFHKYGLHDVKLTASIASCDFTHEKPEYVRVYPMPNPRFTVKNPAHKLEELAFVNTSDTLDFPVETHWDFGDGKTDTTYTPTHFYVTEGVYPVVLTQRTVPECQNVSLIDLVIERNILIPNVFTPNNDGINDVFLENMNVHFIIINRWGQKLYEGTDGWDGTFEGKDVAAGTYFYVVSLPNGDVAKGPVTLLRNE